jgi:hypothetical protein
MHFFCVDDIFGNSLSCLPIELGIYLLQIYGGIVLTQSGLNLHEVVDSV